MPELIVPCTGGIDLQSDPTNCAPGTLRDCLNFEANPRFGYSLCNGWARYDGSITGEELTDFFYVRYDNATGWNSVNTVYGERVSITVTQANSNLSTSFVAISLGWYEPYQNPGQRWLLFAYTNPRVSSWVAVENSTMIAALGSGGFSVTTASSKVYETGVYNVHGDISGPARPLQTSDFSLMLAVVAKNHRTAVNAVPGNSLSPVDSHFLLNDVTYCTHDCYQFPFFNGTDTNSPPLEGIVLKNTGGTVTYGTILSTVQTSGDWAAGTASGSMTLYDVPPGFTYPSVGTQIVAYSADGITALGNIFQFNTSSAINQRQPLSTRSMLYKTSDQTSGPTYVAGWTRLPLSREIPYSQAYTGQTTGIGLGPTGGSPYSIYEYTRQGLGTTLSQLSPLATPATGCTVAASGNSWTNINNIKVNDGSFAVSPTILAGRYNVVLNATGFAFKDANGVSLPPNTPILGIAVTIVWKASVANTIQDLEVNLFKPDGTLTQNKSTNTQAPTTSTTYTYGGSNDMWGAQWTLAQLLSSSFGVRVNFKNSGASSATASVDFIGVQVTYVPPSRLVYFRNSTNASPTDVPAFVVHYTLDNNTQFTSNNGIGTLTIFTTTTEAAMTDAGKTRLVGAGEQIRDAPGGAGNILGYTTSKDQPSTFPSSASLDANQSRWEWRTYNFYADPSAQMAFGANGVEYGIGFDGTYLVRIRTGRAAALDNPRHVFGYANNLHLGYNSGDTIITAPGRPLTVSGLQLSQLYNIGQPVVGYASLQGQTLAVFGKSAVIGLQGTDPTNYTQITLSPALGAFEYTVADIEGSVVWTSFRGVETMQTTNAYGNFETIPLSSKATPWLQPRLQNDSRLGIQNGSPVYAFGVRNKRQYRLFFADGYTFSLTLFGPNNDPVCTAGYNQIDPYYPAVARHIYQGVRSDGKEVLYGCWDVIKINYGRGTETGPPNQGIFPYSIRLDQGYAQDLADNGVFAGLDFNPIYPGNQVQNLSVSTECQYQYMDMYASVLIPAPASNPIAGESPHVTVYSQAGDDVPILRSNPLIYSNGAGPGYPYDNYIDQPSTGNGQVLYLAQRVSNVYLPPPMTANQVNLVATGRMIHIMIDASEMINLFTFNSINISKLVITYDSGKQSRN